ncbi:MAG: hypothetical protein ABFR53_06325 [Actinomycetota bacterium]
MTSRDPNDHLALLAEVADSLTGAGIRVWLSGGWAMDFHARSITRPHSDIDLIVGAADRPELWSVLRSSDLLSGEIVQGVHVEHFLRAGVQVEFTYIASTSGGQIITPGLESWPWPAESFPDELVTFRGVSIRLVSLTGLLDMKTNYAAHFDVPLRPHDVADIEALNRLVRMQLAE